MSTTVETATDLPVAHMVFRGEIFQALFSAERRAAFRSVVEVGGAA